MKRLGCFYLIMLLIYFIYQPEINRLKKKNGKGESVCFIDGGCIFWEKKKFGWEDVFI